MKVFQLAPSHENMLFENKNSIHFAGESPLMGWLLSINRPSDGSCPEDVHSDGF
jgi:hypothetical protein